MKNKVERVAEECSFSPKPDVLPELQEFCRKNGIVMHIIFRNAPKKKEQELIDFLLDHDLLKDDEGG